MEKIFEDIEAEGGLETEYDKTGVKLYAELLRLRPKGTVTKGDR